MRYVVLILLFLSCSVRAQDFKINFELNSDGIDIHKLRFYVSNIIINDSVNPEQQSAYLIDLLSENSNAITLMIGDMSVSKVSFHIGTDSLLNTAGILDGDLDPIKGMYWAWNTGYINFKLEGKSSTKQPFEYHVGGYRAPYATVRTFETEVISDNLTLELDLELFLKEAQPISTSLMIPGKEAYLLTDIFKKSFHVKE